MPITVENLRKARQIEYAIEKFLKAIDHKGKVTTMNNKLAEASYRYFLPFVDAYMKFTIDEINKAFAKQYINKSFGSFEKDKAVDITTNLLDWRDLDNTGAKMLKPATLEIMANSGNLANKIAGIEGSFDIINPKTVEVVNEICSKLITQVNGETRNAINEIIRQGLLDGKSMGKIAKEIKPLVGLTSKQAAAVGKYEAFLGVKRPDLSTDKINRLVEKYTNKLHNYRTDMIARTESMRAVNEGQRLAYVEEGYKTLIWSANAGACPQCAAENGHEYGIEEAEGMIPTHPDCYNDKTEVYSDKGWRLFKDLKGDELILSLNPETFGLEWLPYIHKIEYYYKGKMIHLQNRWFDLVATPNHNQLFGRRIDGRNDRKKKKWEIKTLQEVIKYAEFYIPRTANWRGKNLKFIDIDNLKIETELFCKFMGIWLSEGSVTQRHKEKGWECYQISISQKPKGLNIIYNEIKNLPVKLGKGRDHITCNDKRLGKYLMQFGHSHEKYIPEEIKQLDSKSINVFLTAYAFGDGHKRVTCWDEKKLINNETVFYTSSSKMAGDIGELILKAGGYPSYLFKQTKGIAQKFKNGTYIINYDMYIVNWNKTKNANFSDNRKNNLIETINYDGMVYDVELPRNHILWVKHNGKTCWSGNCRCTWLTGSKKEKAPEEQIPTEENPRREHLEGDMPKNDAIKQFIDDAAKQGKIYTEKEAEEVYNSVKAYSGGLYKDIRSYQTNPEKFISLNKPKIVKDVKKIAGNLDEFFKYSTKYEEKIIYRGIDLAKEEIALFKKGQIIDMGGASSFSSDPLTAARFGNVQFRLKNKTGVSIKHISFSSSENEIILPKNIKFKITKIKEISKEIYDIHIEEVL